MPRILIAVLLCLSLACLTAPTAALAQYDERILSYVSEIEIMPDSSLNVTETITVRAAGVNIRRGIYRDFPTVYNDTMFKRYHVGFILDAVLHNGTPSPYHIEPLSNGQRIYVGDSNTFISSGEHEYTFRYRTIKQLGFYPEGDELYWNVTGTDWMFPIDYAEARVKLPERLDSADLRMTAYTGPMFSQQANYESKITGSNEVVFSTTQPMGPYSGLTIVLGFPKGVVTPPTDEVLRAFWIEQHPGEMFGIYGVAGVFVFLLLCWIVAGVDPRKGAVRPVAEPPQGLSPAALRYIRRMGCDFTCFTAAVTNLATKGYISISVDSDGDYTLKREKSDFRGAYGEEAAMATALFGSGNTIAIDRENHATISAAKSALAGALSSQYRRVYFFLNRGMSTLGILATIGVLIGMGIAAPTPALIILPLFIAAVLLIIINIIFWFLLPRFTTRGRRLLDEIEGFKLTLQYGSEDALGHEGEDADQLHERYLGYAIALDAHEEWAKRLEQRIRNTGGDRRYYGWYNDPYRDYDRYNYHNLTHNLARDFTSSVSSASVSPSSSSGSSGFSGGSSGGGGGGGGGGGW